MMQIFGKGTIALVMAGALAAAGCGSEDGNSGTTSDAGVSDSGSDAGATDGTSADGAGENKDATDAGDSTAPKTCSPKCTDKQTCEKQTDNTYKCIDKPCGGPCPSGEQCDTKANACFKPCGGPCQAGEVCDMTQDGGKGKCVKPTCADPDIKLYTDNTNINKVSKLSILAKDKGCDLNGDGTIDNVLGKVLDLYASVNDTLDETVKDGSLVILLVPDGFKTDGSNFTASLLIGAIDEAVKKDCDASKQGDCKYLVSKSSFDPLSKGTTCQPYVTFDPVTVKAGDLKAGGDKQNFELNLDITGIQLKLRISKAQLSGKQTDDKAWKTTTGGMLCGVITEEDLDAAVDKVPDEELAKLGFDKATIKGILAGLLKSDIDTDGDGKADAKSVGLGLETFQADVTGYEVKK